MSATVPRDAREGRRSERKPLTSDQTRLRGRDGLVALGERLRQQREQQGLSLRELARRIDVSPSLISQIETDKVRPSVGTLYQIVTELGGSLDELFFDDPVAGDAAIERRLSDHPHVAPVQRRATRKVIQLSSGVTWERLTTESVPGIDFLYVIYEPGGESSPADTMQRHPGREWGYIDAGQLHVTVGAEAVVLGPGDSIVFDSTVPHRLWNPGTEPVHGVWFVLGRHSGLV